MFIAIQYKSDLLESFGAVDASDNSLSVGNADDACDRGVIDDSTKNITASNALIFFLSFLNGGIHCTPPANQLCVIDKRF
jgi:hypothetical protein